MITYSIISKSHLEGALRLDPEYYQPEFLSNAKLLEKYGYSELKDLSTIGITKGETPLWRGDNYIKEGIPFLRSENLIPIGLELDDIVFISNKVNERMKRSKIYPNDVLVAIVGATIGKTGLVTDDFEEYNTNQANAIVRPQDEKKSAYLSIVLETKICQLQIERLKGGGARDNLDLNEVQILKIPKTTSKLFEYSFAMVKKIRELRKSSQSLYTQAEDLLLEDLGLAASADGSTKLTMTASAEDLTFTTSLKDCQQVGRIDADFFQPKYERILSKIKVKKEKLSNLVSWQKGIEPGSEEYAEEGRPFIRVSNMSKFGINDNNQQFLSEKLYGELKDKYQPKKGEILLSKDATPGIAVLLEQDVEGIISGGTLRLKIKDKNLNPQYLSLVLNSLICQMQIERDAGGSIIIHWRPDQVENTIIPILPLKTQQKIAELVNESFKLRKEAKELLEEAKKRVEEEIEKN